MNRLGTWTVGQVGFVQNNLQAPLILSPFVGMRIDVNTAPEARPPASALPAIIEEILSESLRIYDEGFEGYAR
jgi:hypothetical protein